MTLHGPADPKLWITRKIGLWETHFFGKLDHTSNCNIVMNTCISAEYLDPDKVEQAYRALIYNQPNFRADVVEGTDGEICFIPATDFSNIFQFIDQSEDKGGVTGYKGCWELAEKLADQAFSFGSGAPLHKCYLVKRPDCYILLNQYHHGIADGTSGFRVINEILRQYNLIISSGEVEISPAEVLSAVGEMAQFAQDDQVVEKMIEERMERGKCQKILLPVDMEEVERSRGEMPWRNRTLSAIGSVEGMKNLQDLCKENNVTIGAYSFAVLFFATAAAYIRKNGGRFPKEGIPTLYTDTVADLRTRLEPSPGDCFMLCIAEIWLQAKIEENSTLLDIAKDIGQQLQTGYREKRLPLFQGAYQDKLRETGHIEFLNSLAEGTICDIFPSNQLVFKYPTKYSWGEVTSIHSLGSYWCPSFVNRVCLYHCVNGVMNYSMVCCDGENNVRDAQELLDLFVEFMENTGKVSLDTNVMDFVSVLTS